MDGMSRVPQASINPTAPAIAGPLGAQAPARKRVSVLGATGSVGRSTLDLMGRNPHMFEVVALTGNSNVDALAELAVRHGAALAVVGDEKHYAALKSRLVGTGIEAGAGAAALAEAAMHPADCVVAAIIGAAGLRPTWPPFRRGGACARQQGVPGARRADVHAGRARCRDGLLPVDSEHSAVFQAWPAAIPQPSAHRADGIGRAVRT
jgi:1-deoxy-D-xylulose-5-phosphate reductoisomerase